MTVSILARDGSDSDTRKQGHSDRSDKIHLDSGRVIANRRGSPQANPIIGADISFTGVISSQLNLAIDASLTALAVNSEWKRMLLTIG